MIPDELPFPDFDEFLARERAQRPDDYAPFRAMVNAMHAMLLARSVHGALSAQAAAEIKERLATVEMMTKDHRERLDALEAGK